MTKGLLKRTLALLATAALGLTTLAPAMAAPARIKDIVDIEGVRDNQLVGYGLVVGLNGTGDRLNNSPFTRQSLTAMLERMGVNTRGEVLRTANVAAVMVTANLPPFATQGTRIDVTVSAMGDASSLQGGTLLVTPLLGATAKPMPSRRVRCSSTAFPPRATPPRSFRACPPRGSCPRAG